MQNNKLLRRGVRNRRNINKENKRNKVKNEIFNRR